MKNLFLMTAFLWICVLSTSAADSTITDLGSLEELQKVFQNDAGKVRIIALLSPT